MLFRNLKPNIVDCRICAENTIGSKITLLREAMLFYGVQLLAF